MSTAYFRRFTWAYEHEETESRRSRRQMLLESRIERLKEHTSSCLSFAMSKLVVALASDPKWRLRSEEGGLILELSLAFDVSVPLESEVVYSYVVLPKSVPVISLGEMALVNAYSPSGAIPFYPCIPAFVGGGDPMSMENGCGNVNDVICGVNSIVSPKPNESVEDYEATTGGAVVTSDVISGEGWLLLIPLWMCL
ncbi:hypothetical protein MA16_Dca017371 [Dendrobium catenatum]|uniref:Uncharacterized protein n=1 Tax=Dendrobium catenatum TaxID=906689 RepID=A0A2I0VRL1_9ASPA|nr:hypothetical protein MA16_Dca017371 [Dendrobium catenatum]